MAIHRLFLLLSIFLGFVAISATARPCKTFIFISSSSTSFPVDGEIPNSPLQNPRFLTLFVTRIRQVNPTSSTSYIDERVFRDRHQPLKRAPFEADFKSPVTNSVRERTLDILSIVGALLFGVGCGALTSATMYLIWSLFSPRVDYGGDSDDEEDSPKKMGYVAIAADNAVFPPPAKQVE